MTIRLNKQTLENLEAIQLQEEFKHLSFSKIIEILIKRNVCNESLIEEDNSGVFFGYSSLAELDDDFTKLLERV